MTLLLSGQLSDRREIMIIFYKGKKLVKRILMSVFFFFKFQVIKKTFSTSATSSTSYSIQCYYIFTSYSGQFNVAAEIK